MDKAAILLVDDELKILASLSEILNNRGFVTITAKSCQEALDLLGQKKPDVALVDLVMPGGDGMEFLKSAKQLHPAIPVIMLTGHGTIAKAVEATKIGAFDFLEKPVESDKIVISIENALERSRLEREKRFFIADAQQRFPLVGQSKVIREIQRLVETVAPSDSKVLITGESGTGKELVARAIHLHSSRAASPFLAVNCAAIPEELIESELFGHEKGAFTGAHQKKEGKFELAGSGTLFLDEIGDMSLKLQAKILRAMEEKQVQRVGGRAAVDVDARIIAASNQDLKQAVHEKKFREDLYFRLSVINLHIPPLRERKEDIPLLSSHFLEMFAVEQKRPPPALAPGAMAVLLDHSWPGNVRELKNYIEKLVVFFSGRSVSREEASALLDDAAKEGDGIGECVATLIEARHRAEREAILKCLVANEWDYEKTYRELAISRATFFNKLREYQIKRPIV